MWIIKLDTVVAEFYSHQLPPEILVHSFINLHEKWLLSKLYGHIYYVSKISSTDGVKSKTKKSVMSSREYLVRGLCKFQYQWVLCTSSLWIQTEKILLPSALGILFYDLHDVTLQILHLPIFTLAILTA